jgi:HEAT repeat protein
MAGKRSLDAQLAVLEGLRSEPPEVAVKGLRKALGQHNNYLVAKAADLARELRLSELMPELLAAFDRFFTDPVKTDPQCWAKSALSRALADLDCQDADVYLRGMRHLQPEPVWGGSSDTAASLRATCAVALVQCRTLTDRDLLGHLIELFGDKEKSVRAEVARAVGQVGSLPAALLLRLRAVLGGDEPDVLGACFSGILSIEGASAIPWLSRFMAGGDDIAAEAALAIAQGRSPEAFHALQQRFASPVEPARGLERLERDDAWFQSVLLSAVALTRQEAALSFLLDLVRTRSEHAEAAIEALLRSAPSSETVHELERIVADAPNLARAFAKHRPKA